MINHITVPEEFVSLASEWYSGMDKLYAIASTGNLTTGTQRPYNSDENRPCTDEEWYAGLFTDLAADLRACLRGLKRHKDKAALKRFLAWAEQQEETLTAAIPA